MENITGNRAVLVRMILAGLLVILLGLSAGANSIRQELSQALWAQANGRPADAASSFEAVVEREAWRVELWLLVGRNAWDAGDVQGTIDSLARPELENLLEVQDRLILGDAYLAAGDIELATQSWQQAVEAGADSSQVIHRLLDLHVLQGDYAAQVDDLKNVIELDPSNALVFLRLGQILSTIDPAAALPYLSQAQVLDSSLASRAGDLRDAIRTGQLSADPAFPFLQAGRILAAQSEWVLARLAFLKATEISPEMADSWAYLGEANYKTDPEDLSRARKALDQALQLNPNSLPANAFMALYWQRQGTIEQAVPYLQQAARLQADNPLWPAALGQVNAAQGNLPLAQAYYEQAVKIDPEEAEYYRLLAEFFIRYQVQVEEGALPAARKAVSLEPEEAINLDVMGQALLLSGEREVALMYFERAIEKDPEYAPALLHLGVAYLEQGKNDLAYPLIDKARSLDPASSTGQQADRLLEYFFP